jgi:hypothetical protein
MYINNITTKYNLLFNITPISFIKSVRKIETSLTYEGESSENRKTEKNSKYRAIVL